MPLDHIEQRETATDIFHGGAVIDDHGREVPITETMIREACERLEGHWVFPGGAAGNR
ncbi:MAG: PA1571 family protein [Alcanivoracaceae bacterium]